MIDGLLALPNAIVNLPAPPDTILGLSKLLNKTINQFFLLSGYIPHISPFTSVLPAELISCLLSKDFSDRDSFLVALFTSYKHL